MATSSFFKEFVIRPEDEEAITKAFDTTDKIKLSKDYTYRMLDKEEGLALLQQMAKDQENEL